MKRPPGPGGADPEEEVSWVGDEEDMGYGGHDEVADDSEHEREVGEGAATAAAREPQGQHRRGRLEHEAAQQPDP